MRKLLLICAVVVCGACDSEKVALERPDMAIIVGDAAMAPLDLQAPSLGCNGYRSCIAGCTNPGCLQNCQNRVTANGLSLNDAIFACQVNYCHRIPVDGGFACTNADIDPNNAASLTPSCTACLGAMATQISAACAAQIAACTADTP
jgi:hypothetical protein